MKLPPQPVTALVYTAAAHSANIWTPESAQGQMLQQLGFSLATLPGGLPASHSGVNATISCSWAGRTSRPV